MYKIVYILLFLSIGVSQTELSLKYRKQFIDDISDFNYSSYSDLNRLYKFSKLIIDNNYAENDSLLLLVCESFILTRLKFQFGDLKSDYEIPEIYNHTIKFYKFTGKKEYEILPRIFLRDLSNLDELLSIRKDLKSLKSVIAQYLYLENETQIASYYRKFASKPKLAIEVIDNVIIELAKLDKSKLNVQNFAEYHLNLILMSIIDGLETKALYIKYAVQNEFGLKAFNISLFENIDKSKFSEYPRIVFENSYAYVKADYYLNKGDYKNATFFFNVAIKRLEEINHKNLKLALSNNASKAYLKKVDKGFKYSIHFDYYNLAYTQIKFEAYEDAIKNLQISYDYRKELFKANHEKIAVSEIWLGHAYSLNGNYKMAEYYFEKGDNSLKLNDYKHIDDYAELEFFRGQLELKLGFYQKSKSSFLKAIELNLKYVGYEHEYLADNFRYLALAEEKLGNKELANKYLHMAIRSLTFTNDDFSKEFVSLPEITDVRKPVLFLRTIADLADNNAALNKLVELEKTANIGIDYLKSIEKNYYNESSKYILNSITSNLYEHKLNLLSKAYAETANIDIVREMIILVDGAKSGNLQREISLREAIIESDHSKEWNGLKNMQNNIIQKENKSESANKLKSNHIKKIEEFTNKFNIDYKSLDLELVNQQLKENQLVLDYFVSSQLIHLVSLEKNSSGKFPIIEYYKINNCEANTSLAKDYVNSIRKHNSKDMHYYQNLISDLLLSKVEDKFERIESLTILPHGFISYIPFSTLKINNNYLIETKSISKHYALSLLTKKQKSIDNEIAFSAFAPVFDDGKNSIRDYDRSFEDNLDINRSSNYKSFLSERGKFAMLKESYNEVIEISEMFNQKNLSTEIYAYDEANESNFKKAAKKSNILHISSHSFYNEIDYNKSAIIFSSPKSSKEDGFLFSNESYLLDINTDLLVLSSCESGKGKLVANEGMLSLSRGFYYAGANNILSSLWKVSDKKTKIMMTSFYKHLLKSKMSYSEALQKAQLDMIRNPETSDPKYWSAFMLIGH